MEELRSKHKSLHNAAHHIALECINSQWQASGSRTPLFGRRPSPGTLSKTLEWQATGSRSLADTELALNLNMKNRLYTTIHHNGAQLTDKWKSDTLVCNFVAGTRAQGPKHGPLKILRRCLTEATTSPLLVIGLFHGAPQHLVFSPSHPSAASDPLKVVRPPLELIALKDGCVARNFCDEPIALHLLTSLRCAVSTRAAMIEDSHPAFEPAPTAPHLFTVVLSPPCLCTEQSHSPYTVHPYPSPVRLQHAFQNQNSPKMFHPKGLKPHIVSTRRYE
ncbi:hypothetical protein MSG28_001254, partial [Choristoneura fumiferana]